MVRGAEVCETRPIQHPQVLNSKDINAGHEERCTMRVDLSQHLRQWHMAISGSCLEEAEFTSDPPVLGGAATGISVGRWGPAI